jgi:cysteinyl-tRNA synthetase
VAKKDQENFLNLDKPTQIASAQLSLDRSQQAMEESKQELAELEAMYKKEDFAELTKELVVSRGRKKLEFSQRGLELAKKGQEGLLNHDLPKKEKELAQAVEKAEKALQEAQAKKDREALEEKLKLMRADHKIDDLVREIDKMKKKSEKKEATA